MSNYKTETKCIQSGYEPGNGEARVLPIYQSTTFRYTSSEQMGRLFDLEESGYFYTRLQNPTNDAVAAKICDLEGGVAAMLTSSGQAANFYAIMNIVEAGDHIVCASALYGGTYNLYAHTIKKMGVEATFVDPECTQEELDAAEGKPYIYDCKVKLDPEKSKDYSVPYWVQGGLFNTYVLENEPIDKWATFKEFNDTAEEAPSFGFDFDLSEVSTQVAGFRNILDEFGKSLYTGSVDPEEYLPQLEKKLEATGVQDVIDEMQKQIDEWKEVK